jgi:tetratricopeptide (TPR) repeat protein
VQIVYISLAVIMGAGLVLFGIGGAVSGGLLDAITQGGGGASTGVDAFQKRVNTAQQATQAHPKDAKAWATLARARFQLASAGDNYNQQTGAYSATGKQQLQAAGDAWQKHVDLAGKHPDDGVAGVMVQAYISLGEYDKAVQAEEIITEARPTSKTFATLAILAYNAGQTRTGDLARQKALSLAPKDQRNTLKAQIDEAQSAAASQAIQNATPTATPSATATPSGKKKSKK